LRSTGNVPDALKDQLLTDFRTADISETDRLILGFAEKITRDAASIDANYIRGLKGMGLTDHMLHDIVQVAAYFAYVNRLADALGVELEG
jgi:uncharacterized peroxidase-related enzyme